MWNRALENRWPSSLQHVITISSRLCEFCNRHLVQDENCITMLLVGLFAAVAATYNLNPHSQWMAGRIIRKGSRSLIEINANNLNSTHRTDKFRPLIHP